MQKWIILLFVHGEFIFHLILMGFFNEFLSKIPLIKCTVYYVTLIAFDIKEAQKEGNFKFFIQVHQCSFLQNDHLNGLLMGH